MDVTDHLRLRQGEEVAVIQEIFLRVLEAFSADVRFRHAVGANRRPHRTVDDGDSILEYLLKRMLLDFHHASPKDLSVAVSAMSRWKDTGTRPELTIQFFCALFVLPESHSER